MDIELLIMMHAPEKTTPPFLPHDGGYMKRKKKKNMKSVSVNVEEMGTEILDPKRFSGVQLNNKKQLSTLSVQERTKTLPLPEEDELLHSVQSGASIHGGFILWSSSQQVGERKPSSCGFGDSDTSRYCYRHCFMEKLL